MTLLKADRLYTGRVLNLDLDRVRFPDGSAGELEMIRHPGAAAVVPMVDPLESPDPRVLLIRQFRHATDGFILEIPAGRLDPGETPEACAHRELAEEAGRRSDELRYLTTIYTTPGFTDERIHLYLATGLTEIAHAREADEFMEVVTLPWREVGRLVQAGEIKDGKTLVALMYVQSFLISPSPRRGEGRG